MLSKLGQTTRQIRQLRRMKKQIERIESEGSAGKGQVRVRVNGARKVRKVTIAPELVERGDVRLLEKLLQAAINDAMKSLDRQLQTELRSMGDLGGMLGGAGGM